ncbi:MAG TPA: pseudaminic acid biosynthesis-associated methylase [Patescibacteria group bacterium]|nr:pseudaminic acid biosynthesis-associated methylase [Patescibacteria group bacterium]
MTSEAEAARLEGLWRGEFGDAYVRRNATLDDRRGAFWADLLGDREITSTLEVGCGQGGNLRHVAAVLPPEAVWGVDVNAEARTRARQNAPGTNVVAALARLLPFRDATFDLTMTVGVLIHQPETTLPLVMAELVRVSRRYVLWVEYHADATTEVAYHGERGALLKRDYGRIYHELFPELEVARQGFLGEGSGFDRVSWQLLRKP